MLKFQGQNVPPEGQQQKPATEQDTSPGNDQQQNQNQQQTATQPTSTTTGTPDKLQQQTLRYSTVRIPGSFQLSFLSAPMIKF